MVVGVRVLAGAAPPATSTRPPERSTSTGEPYSSDSVAEFMTASGAGRGTGRRPGRAPGRRRQDGVHVVRHEDDGRARAHPGLVVEQCADGRRVVQVQDSRGSSASSRAGSPTMLCATRSRCCSPPTTGPRGRGVGGGADGLQHAVDARAGAPRRQQRTPRWPSRPRRTKSRARSGVAGRGPSAAGRSRCAGSPLDRTARDLHRAAFQGLLAEDDLEQAGLAGAVGAEDGDELAGGHVEVEAGPEPAVAVGQRRAAQAEGGGPRPHFPLSAAVIASAFPVIHVV